MNNREKAQQLLSTIPESKLLYVIGFLEGAAIPEDEDPFFSPENMRLLQANADEMERTGGTVHEVEYDD